MMNAVRSAIMGDDPYNHPPATARILPFSCSTNLSNDVDEHLARAKLGSAAVAICLLMRRRTFGNAGNQRDKGEFEPGLWCDFALAEWSQKLLMNKSNLRRARDELVACHIIFFYPGEALGTGRLRWNLNFDEWVQYNRRPGRTAANEAKRREREEQTNVVELT